MSNANVKKFFAELENNPALKNRFDSLMGECAGQDDSLLSTRIVDFAVAAGFNCSAEDFEDVQAKCRELSDEDMEKISAGYWKVYPPSWWYKEKYSKGVI